MTTVETVKAWKDEDYRDALTQTEREKLPANPAGVIECGPAALGGESALGPGAVLQPVMFRTFRCSYKRTCPI
jgi:mersacidin/lichenicidin family type 2 lantibiotic